MATLRSEIDARITAIQDKLAFDILELKKKAQADMSTLKAVSLLADTWVDEDTDQFQQLVNKVISIVRQK